MWFQNILKSLTSTPTRRQPIRRSPPASRLSVEALEDRTVPAFLAPVSYPVGTPQFLLTADFNGDGRLDLAAVNYNYNSTVSVLLGNANGTFQPALTSATGFLPLSLAVGDFNGDGKLDLVTANSYDVSVLLGNGNGTFQAPNNIGLGSYPASAAVGDFNGDGKLDVGVTSNGYSYYGDYGYANVLLGNGDGGFSGPYITSLGYGHHSGAAAANLNGDGFDDFVTVNGAGRAANVLMGDSSGYLQGPHNFLTADYPVFPRSVAAGDINGDGKVDLVTANYTGNNISVLLGDGLGSFSAPENYATGLNPVSVVLGDFTGDGKIDIATANSNSNDLSVLHGGGDGTFSSAVNSAVGLNPMGVAAGDFNGDGWLDAATANYGGNDVSVLLNTGEWRTFAVSGFPSSTTAGVAGSFTVTARNSDDSLNAAYTGTVHFSSSDGQAVLPPNYTFTAADGGMHTFNATLKTAGMQSITATDTTNGSLSGSEVGITVNAAAASSVTVAGFPSPVTAGVAGNLIVTLKDAFGNVASAYTGTVHFTSSDAKAVLPANYTFTAADAGKHTFSATLKTAGTQSITATDTTRASLTGTEGGITVNPAAASKFLISAPSSVRSGVAFSFTITVQDAYGNVVTGYIGTIHFSSSDSSAKLPANYTFTATDKGVHTFTGLVLRKKGSQTITVTDTLNSSLTGSVIEKVL